MVNPRHLNLGTITDTDIAALAEHLPEAHNAPADAPTLPPHLRKLCVRMNSVERQIRRLRKIVAYAARKRRKMLASLTSMLHETQQILARLKSALLQNLEKLKVSLRGIRRDELIVIGLDREWHVWIRRPSPEIDPRYTWLQSGVIPLGVRIPYSTAVAGAQSSRNGRRVAGPRPF